MAYKNCPKCGLKLENQSDVDKDSLIRDLQIRNEDLEIQIQEAGI